MAMLNNFRPGLSTEVLTRYAELDARVHKCEAAFDLDADNFEAWKAMRDARSEMWTLIAVHAVFRRARPTI